MLATNEAKQQNRLHPVGEHASRSTPRFGQTLFAVFVKTPRKALNFIRFQPDSEQRH
jgi:hypothetical protein